MKLVQLLKDRFNVAVVANDEMLEMFNPDAEALWIVRVNTILVSSKSVNDISTIGHEAIHVIQEYRSDLFGAITNKMYDVLGYQEVTRIKGLVFSHYDESRLVLEMQSYCWEKWYQLDGDAALDWLVSLV